MIMRADEKVLCIRRNELPAEWIFDFVAVPMSSNHLNGMISSVHFDFFRRRDIENNPEYKQLIPYVIVFDAEQRILTYRRQGTEKRLHSQYSVGVGGHINEYDHRRSDILVDTLMRGMLRECLEELHVDCNNFLFRGIINEEKTEVGHSHLGLVFTASVDENQQIFSEELKDICFRTEKDIMELKLELWSILAMKLLVADNI